MQLSQRINSYKYLYLIVPIVCWYYMHEWHNVFKINIKTKTFNDWFIHFTVIIWIYQFYVTELISMIT